MNIGFVRLLIAAVLLLRIFYVFEDFWIIDEASYASVANKLVDGHRLYGDAWDNKPPFIYLFYALIFWIFGKGNMVAVHVASLPFVLLGIWLLYRIVREYFPERIARCAAGAYGLYLAASPRLDVLATNTEIFLVPVLLAATYLAILALRRNSGWCWAASGALFGFSGWIKQPGLLFCLMVPVVAALGMESLAAGPLWRAFRRCLQAFAGFCAMTLVGLAAVWQLGVLPEFLEAVFFFNAGVHIGSISAEQAASMAFFTLYSYVRFHFASLTLAAVGLILAVRTLLPAQRPDSLRQGAVLVLSWTLLSTVLVSVGGRFYGFYFQVAAPAVSTLIGWSLNWFWEQWPRYTALTRRAMAVFALTGLLYPMYVFHGWMPLRFLDRFVPADSAQATVEEEEEAPADEEPDEDRTPLLRPGSMVSLPMRRVVQYVQYQTLENDRIFVWGYQPQVYVLSARNFATRYNTASLQTGFIWGTMHQLAGWGYLDPLYYRVFPELATFHFTPADTAKWAYPGSMERLLADLGEAPPELFIDGNVEGEWPFGTKYPLESFAPLQQFLNEDYQLETILAGYRIYRKRRPEYEDMVLTREANGQE